MSDWRKRPTRSALYANDVPDMGQWRTAWRRTAARPLRASPPRGLGWAWLAPLITGVIDGQTKSAADASGSFAQAQGAIAQHRADEERRVTITTVATIIGVTAFLGLGAFAVYRLSK